MRLLETLDHFDHREEHRDNDRPDHAAEQNHHQRLKKRHKRFDRNIDLFVVVVSDLHEHGVHVTGFLADIDHVDDDRVACLGFTERVCECFAFTDRVVDLSECFLEDIVPRGLPCDGDGFEDRDTPALISVPSVLVKRAMVVLRMRCAEDRCPEHAA